MSSHSSNPGALDQFDTGPLSWVMEEIRASLTRASALGLSASGEESDARATSLRQAGALLHQARGALQIVDIAGAPQLIEAMEELLTRAADAEAASEGESLAAVAAGCRALIEYLDELLAGVAPQALRLYPYFRDLQQARGISRVHPSDLYFPDLTIRPRLATPAVAASAADVAQLRQRFEKALLPLLKSTDAQAEKSSAAVLADVLADFVRRAPGRLGQAYWWVLHGFAAGVATGEISPAVHVKQLFGRINMQLRKLDDAPSETSERLLRDALFFIATAADPSPKLQQIRQVYGLSAINPDEVEIARYGLVDSAILHNARERLQAAKAAWDRVAAGDMQAGASFAQEIAVLAELVAGLRLLSLDDLTQQLRRSADQHRATQDEALALDVAASLLFLENALRHGARSSASMHATAASLAARLAARLDGVAPAGQARWLDQFSRDAQQRDTVAALADEMRGNLAQVEKLLDEFFSNSAKRTALAPIDGILHQIEGGLSILDLDQAVLAVRNVRAQVAEFALPEFEGEPGRPEFQQVARNLGLLSFFLESLRVDSEAAKGRFVFDIHSGLFRNVNVPRGQGREVDVAVVAESQGAAMPGADAVLAEPATADAAKPAAPLETEAAKPATDLSQPLHAETVTASSPIAAEADAADTAMPAPAVPMAAAMIADGPDWQRTAASHPSAEGPVPAEQAHGFVAAPDPVPTPIAESTSDEAVDAELLEIFLGEAEEVLENVATNLPLLRMAPHDQASLTTLRRAFHTLKGSGRMVGLNAFGEAAWGLEKTLNLALSDGTPASTDLCDLIERAHRELSAWVTDLKQEGSSARRPDALVFAAEAVRDGGKLPAEEAAPLAAPAKAVSVLPDQSGAAGEAPYHSETLENVEAVALMLEIGQAPAAGIEHAGLDAFATAGHADHVALPQRELADLLSPEHLQAHPMEAIPAQEDLLPAVGEVQLPELPALEEAGVSDTEALLDDIQEPTIPDQTTDATQLVEMEMRDDTVQAHADDASIDDMTPAHPAETVPMAQVISFPEVHPVETRLDDSIKRIGNLEISVPLHNIYLAETDDLVRVLAQDLSEWRHEAGRTVNTVAVHAAHSLAGSSATVGFVPLQEVAYALERVLQALARKPVPLSVQEFDALDAAVGELKQMLRQFALGDMPPAAPYQVRILEEMRQQVMARAATVVVEVQSALPAFIAEEARQSGDAAADMSGLAEPDQVEAADPGIPGARTRPLAGFGSQASAGADLAPTPETGAAIEPSADAGRMPYDELDPDLLPVFLEEASDLLPQIQLLLRAWQAEPASREPVQGLLRLLHTVKGSARMAGAMRLGQQMHDMESRIEQVSAVGTPTPAVFEDLLGRFDVGLYLHDQLQNPEAGKLAPAVVHGAVSSAVVAEAPAEKNHASASAPLLRVRVDIVDRLVNQAGEVSISRSRVENGVSGLNQSLSELTDNVTRLRSQLRELEIQAESQMASQMAHSAERGFDPLEFDRFTRLQELTRMITETVSDVSSVQQNLVRGVEQASADLQQQSRLTRDLQQDLMRVRMVQFGSVAERLYRVTRQAAKELDKRVNLDIRGGAVEIDRGVLEKMAGPFEHLLRNAIVHGIESREERLAAGKKDIGELKVEIRQEGNEVVIQFSDDGRGLDLARIRARAEAAGFLEPHASPSDAELRELVFHPGFSTAQDVTELAGRGIGMDVVRSEAAGLGGRVAIDSQPGHGATFMVRLPLTLAVTQVVVLTTGGNTYAVPSVLVEQVQQLKAGALADAYAEGAVTWRGEQVPLYYLSELLGDGKASPVTQQYSPLLILKSGESRVAVHVDDVLGNREVVVKNVGPQLARMAGVAGATVLGSGDIVLILDPVPLAQRLLETAPRSRQGARPASGQASHAPHSQPIVMVVDDSLTVRRVTQRFLTREGYQVMLAKDGVDALEQLQTVTPDLMLVDIEMPRMDGFDLTRNVRGDSRTRHIPIIMITSRTATKHRNYAMDLGVNEYLGKPYQEADLLKFVLAFTGREMPAAAGQ
ncbi:hybrid sensor histidine kinase/response regulator [Noviherbaspirillum soli]|uniref:hybrid sensor histidine kinase/response regulator n=1 Tax=Noviherbaspirillum soli TaxID=1064518 RepID=UPI001E44D665|nr:Hpt domain-containing protein [Noviherbaspirillum soli]